MRHRDRLLWTDPRPWGAALAPRTLTLPPKPREVFIQGVTRDGKTFRPSDWAERLAGAMSSFRPDRPVGGGIGAFIGYSPYCVPQVVGGVTSSVGVIAPVRRDRRVDQAPIALTFADRRLL